MMFKLCKNARAVVLVGILASVHPGYANLLTNPGFESDPPGQSQNIVGWTWFGQPWGNTLGETDPGIARTGSNYFKVFQGFTGVTNYNGIYQDYISGPGATYSADGWAYTSSNDKLVGRNIAWIEVTFRDVNATILALYRSSVITTNSIAAGTFPVNTWIDLPVTNQFNPATYVITNSTARLVAPQGTCFVRYQIVLQGDSNPTGGSVSGGSVYFDDLTLNQTAGAPYGNWNIVWNDEFNNGAINTNIWTFDTGGGGWGNNELEYYTSRPQNAFVSGGVLHIVAQQDSYGGGNYTSARLKTQGLFCRQYGRFEWRARLPQGTGFWPALWLLGTNITSVHWPGCGEIDVMENNGGVLTNVQGSLHSGSDETLVYTLPGGDSVTNFHTYTLDWATNSFLWYVDGHLYQMQTSWSSSLGAYPTPFNRPFFLVMNLAVGGSYLGNPGTNTINANSVFPGDMQVDYVRIYDQTGPLQLSIARTNSNLLLTWPANIICHLQSRTNFIGSGDGAGWADVVTPTNFFLVFPASSNAFYRLQSP